MSEQQISKLAGALVEHQRRFAALPTADAQWVIENTAAAIALFVAAVANRANGALVQAKKLLRFVTTVSVGALENFVAADNYKVDTSRKAKVRIAWLGENFKKHLLGLSEGACEAADLRVHELLEQSVDAPIITELANRCEITLGKHFVLLSKQGRGESGVLLTNGYANIAYIRDANGVLWAVNADWYAGYDGWGVEAYSVEDPYEWFDGGQFVSR